MGESVTRYHIASTWPTGRACWHAVARRSPRTSVSIPTVRQAGRGDDATLVLVTHAAPDAALAATVEELRWLPVVRAVTSRDAGREATLHVGAPAKCPVTMARRAATLSG